jgi:hypothetical protein
VNKQQKPPLTSIERFRNLTDALAEDVLLDPGSSGRADEALAFKMELAHLARPGETPEEHIARLRRELQKVRRAPIRKVNREHAERDHTQEVAQYLRKIREVQSAAGLPVTGGLTELRRSRRRKSLLPSEPHEAVTEQREETRKRQKKNPPS